jgi:hypothetical protein
VQIARLIAADEQGRAGNVAVGVTAFLLFRKGQPFPY